MRHKRIKPMPALAHLPFYESLSSTIENSPDWNERAAALLCFRLVDRWWREGISAVEPEAFAPLAVRRAIARVEPSRPAREVLIGILNAMQAAGDPDLGAVLPRIFAYAELVERRGEFALAADAFGMILQLVDEIRNGDLFNEAQIRLGYCQRERALFAEADQAYRDAIRTAQRRRDHRHRLIAAIGLANVARDRGDLPHARHSLEAVVMECRQMGLCLLESQALQDSAIVAHRQGDSVAALRMTHAALEHAASDFQREKALANLGQFLVAIGAYPAARDALLIQEASATGEPSRIRARINLMSLAARTDDRVLFARCSRLLIGAAMTPDLEVNCLIEGARGLWAFGDAAGARAQLEAALSFAGTHRLNRATFEVEAMLMAVDSPMETKAAAPVPEAAARVESELRRMALAISVP